MNELEEMRTFVQLVDAGTATKAAAVRGVAVSAISRRMKELEARLGVQLLQRTTRKMRLTAEGRVFYDRSVRILADLSEAEAEVTQQSAVLRGKLKVATPLSFGVAHLSSAIAAFMHAHPDIDVDLDMSDRRVDLVEEGFDVAIRIGTLKDSSLMARKLADVQHVVCGAPELFRQYGTPEHPSDLEGWPGLCYGNLPNPPLWSFTAPNGDEGTVMVNTRFQATNGDALRETAIAGLGILCEPSFIVHQAVERDLLKAVLTEYRWYNMGIYAVYPPTRHLSLRVRRFIDFLAERFGPTPYWDEFLDQG
ncbi:MAG: LysR family transcriptional regulator [Pseudomonadota bacterium]